MDDLIRSAIDLAEKLGSDYTEVRFQSDTSESLVLKNGSPEATEFTDLRGFGIRVILDRSLGFASTNLMTRQTIHDAVKRAVRGAQASAKTIHEGVSMGKAKLGDEHFKVGPRINFANVDLDARITLLKEADQLAVHTATEVKTKLPSRLFTLDTWTTETTIMSSDGANVSSRIPRVALNFFLTAYTPQRGTAQRYFNLGETAGWEAVEKWNLPSLFAAEARSLSTILTEASLPPTGEMDLILGPEVVGIICHESCGHPAEADRILGREGAQAGETYLNVDSTGFQVGSSVVNVVDDPTLPNSFGFYRYDAEGVKATRRTLVKEGRIHDFFHNRETSTLFGVSSNASARASAYDREPIIRMANTFLAPGDHSKEELIEDVQQGIYMKSFMEWNIDDRRFNQRYVGLEAYRIRKGELMERIRNPILEITTVGFWSGVDAVGRDLEFQAAYCGKGDPMQAIPVWTGGPHARLRKIRLGGVSS